LRGVLLIGERTADPATAERLTLAAHNGLRIVTLSANIESPTIPSITVNHQSVGLIATRHLIEAGHRRIAYIGPGAARRRGNSQAAARQRGYELALTEAGFSAGATLIDDLDEVTSHAANVLLHRLTALSEPPTGLFVFNDMRALAIIGAAERRGLRVPGDLAVVGVDNLAIGALVSPPLTSVEQPVRELVAAALDALVGPQGSDGSRIIEPRIVPRASSGTP
jgi:DNA-binding LacI/PurR family transcriptional regulator